MRLFSLLIVLLISTSIFASQVDEDYEVLKNVPANYSTFGTICEEVARLRMKEIYPSDQYDVIIGIEYSNSRRTLGELDVVVFDNFRDEAVVIAEVKCWKNLTGAYRKAIDQLTRFENAIYDRSVKSLSKDGAYMRDFTYTQFDEDPEMITISQNGGRRHGFDMELGINLSDAKELRNKLVKCQNEGRCPKTRAN
jgi:hypothetical protein